jgi:hypothetical protein
MGQCTYNAVVGNQCMLACIGMSATQSGIFVIVHRTKQDVPADRYEPELRSLTSVNHTLSGLLHILRRGSLVCVCVCVCPAR